MLTVRSLLSLVNGDLAQLTKLVTQFNETDFDVEAAGT